MAKEKILHYKTRDVLGDGRFEGGFLITDGTKYITCIYFTNWPHDRCEYYRIPKEEFTTPDQAIDDIWHGRIPRYIAG